jgi:hypothetical protein
LSSVVVSIVALLSFKLPEVNALDIWLDAYRSLCFDRLGFLRYLCLFHLSSFWVFVEYLLISTRSRSAFLSLKWNYNIMATSFLLIFLFAPMQL